MTDILHYCGHITHQMKIICMFEVFSASCIRLFDRLSVIGVLRRSEICLVSRWREDQFFLHAVYLRFYEIACFISSEIYIKSFMATFGSHLSHIQDVFKSHCHCHCHCHVIAMTFIEIQKIFVQLFVTLPRKFKSA